MRKIQFKGLSSKRGAAMVEFALLLPLLFVLCMGATDFGRLFYHAVTVANSAAVGSFHGAQNNVTAAEFSLMEQRAAEDARNITAGASLSTDFAATADRFCDCPDNPAVEDASGTIQNTVDCLTATCAGYGEPRAFVRTRVSQTFNTLGPYPGIPRGTLVRRHAFMRVQ